MATKKIPISFNDVDRAKIQELADLMGIAGVYGDFPKALKFGINLGLSALKNSGKVYSGLSDDELDVFFQSRLRWEKKARQLKKADELVKNAGKV